MLQHEILVASRKSRQVEPWQWFKSGVDPYLALLVYWYKAMLLSANAECLHVLAVDGVESLVERCYTSLCEAYNRAVAWQHSMKCRVTSRRLQADSLLFKP